MIAWDYKTQKMCTCQHDNQLLLSSEQTRVLKLLLLQHVPHV